MLRLLASALVTLLALLATAQASTPSTIFLDPLNGATSQGSISGTNTVSFTPMVAVFSSPNDGIMYPAALFPAEGVIEVRLRVDAVGALHPHGPTNFGAIIDSAGVDARLPGDLFLVVLDTGVVRFTMSSGSIPPFNEFQIEGTTSIIDGQFHGVGLAYGSGGIELVECGKSRCDRGRVDPGGSGWQE